MTARDTEETRRIRLRIRGRVQGVGFRFAAVEQARRLGLRGWVRNTADGGVEVVAEGSQRNLRRFAAWCHEGPPGAHVADVDESSEAAEESFTEFRIRF